MRRASRLAGVLVLAGLLVVAFPAAAQAHSVLLGTSPGDGTTATTVTTEVTLTFNEVVHGNFSTIVVNGPGGSYDDGSLQVIDNVVHQPVHPLPSGSYQVAWRVVSADGHPVSGSFAFTVALPPELEPSPWTPPATDAAPATSGPASPRWWGLPVILAVLVAGALLLWRRKR